ncbi:helix-turn-helix transcriptional regulator [Streptomyces sp. NBC_01136]|uniref:helix-turn-helix domain-containing protein n=1 Tax=Streptomyces sp. NBC_01136 TaxID=2903754 RepID=UPI00386BFECF|nr:helix-turn-helix transcriptional regulator [Streptomyces sp. NBC_01136]
MRSPGFEGKPLSPGQLAALRLAASGYTSRQIAARLETTEQGVHLRLKEAAVRLGAKSRTHAVVIALRRCVIRFDDLELPSAAGGVARTASSGPRSAQGSANGARDVRGAARPPQGRSGDFGEAAA